jgi:anti-sigma regulatory factor (Ser/Thr protein kinase)
MRFYLFHALLLVRCLNVATWGTISWLAFRGWRRREPTWGGVLLCLLSLSIALNFLGELVRGLFVLPGAFNACFRTIWHLFDLSMAPLLLHLFCRTERCRRPLSRAWDWAVGLLYVCSFATWAIAVFWWASTSRWGASLDSLPRSIPGLPLLLATAASLVLVFGGYREAASPAERSQGRWMLSALGALLLVRLGYRVWEDIRFILLLNLVPTYCAFVLTYIFLRVAFFDILVKRIVFFLLALALLSVYFSVVPPWIRRVHWGDYNLLIWSMSVWPLVVVTPWAYARLTRWLDATWLGRRYSPIEAGQHFLAGIQVATAEIELVELAKARLAEIFGSQAIVCLNGPSVPVSPGSGESLEAPITVGGQFCGSIRITPRPGGLHFLSEDLTLLRSLAGTFSFMLDNLRLRARKGEQERREQELRLLASRSELKALRAEVNPHFLFNALSAITGLIRREPERAETTVEQLAEVFRYTLRRSEKEWVLLDEELDFVSAYLDVEHARYGSRLQVRIEVDTPARSTWVPAMILQVLVENAIQHGIAAVRGPGAVEIRGRLDGEQLALQVLDTGPGFAEGKPGNGSSGSGYGLRNIQERLAGYFADRASLRFGRTEGGMTSVTVELPANFAPHAEGMVAR